MKTMPSFVRLLIAPALVGGLVASSHDADASCIPGFDYAAFGKNSVVWGGGATSDSYTSAGGADQYDSTHQNADGNIGTNGDQCDVINFNGTSGGVNGNVEYGTSGTSCSVDGGNYTGSAYPQGTEPAFPSVVIPSTPSCAGAANISSPADGTVLPANTCYGDVSSKNTLVLQTGTYIMKTFSTTAGGVLSVPSTAGNITIYISCSGSSTVGIDMKGNAVSNPSLISTKVIFMVAPTCTSISITGGADASYAVYAPDTDVKITGNSDLYGAIVGKSIDATGGAKIHYDKALKTAPGGAFTCTTSEISRGAPVSATIGSNTYVVQGTYEYPFATYQTLTPSNASTWQFQYIRGHLRKRDLTNITTSGTAFDTSFDMTIPSVVTTGCTATNGSCRRIYTNTNGNATNGVTWQTNLNILQFNDTNATAIANLIVAGLKSTFTWTSTNKQSIVRAVLNAQLGGVDRSTVAVIGPSSVAGRSDRPTIAYFGGTDGMLHAVCMTTGKDAAGNAVCPTVGAELWAFMPRVQLPLVGSNSTRLDGSVHVVDAYGDFTTQTMTGTKSYKTILVFQTGFSNALTKPAAYAVNVTDPANPVFLWEYTTPTSPATVDFGVGVTSTPNVALISSKNTNFVAFATNNGGSGTSGIFVTARQLETGAKLWTNDFTSTYPTADGVPDSAVPGGAVAVDLSGQGTATDLVFGDIDGRLWRINAATGANQNGSNPLFKFSTVRHPIGAKPAIFSNGTNLYAAFTSGGYIDHSGATAWADSTQYVIAVKVNANASTTSITEANAGTICSTCNVAVKQSFSGSKGFAQVSVVGTTLQVLTDTSDVNAANYGTTADTGRLFSFDLGTSNPSATPTTVASGGSAMTVVKLSGGATLVGSSGTKQQVVASSVGTSGTSVDFSSIVSGIVRRLWLRME
jgi:hypothetical protein